MPCQVCGTQIIKKNPINNGDYINMVSLIGKLAMLSSIDSVTNSSAVVRTPFSRLPTITINNNSVLGTHFKFLDLFTYLDTAVFVSQKKYSILKIEK